MRCWPTPRRPTRPPSSSSVCRGFARSSPPAPRASRPRYPRATPQSPSPRTGPRARLRSLRRRLRLRRTALAAAVTRVGFRLLGATRARRTSARTFSRASSRLRCWSRVRWLVTSRRPWASSRRAASARSRARASSGSPSARSRSTRSSTRDATLLTFWPPGPEERVARTDRAASGTITPGATTMGSAMREPPRSALGGDAEVGLRLGPGGRAHRVALARLAIRGQGGGQDLHRRAQVVLLQHVRDAHLVAAEAGSGVEALRRRHHDRRAPALEIGQQPARELLGIVHRQPRHEVERALRLAQEHARHAREALVEEVAPLLVLGAHALGVLGSQLARAHRGHLGQPRRGEPALRHLQGSLRDLVVAADQAPQSDAAGAVALALAVD